MSIELSLRWSEGVDEIADTSNTSDALSDNGNGRWVGLNAPVIYPDDDAVPNKQVQLLVAPSSLAP